LIKLPLKKSSLKDIIRELSLSDIAQVSRTSAANILGLEDKGHLGVGADADVAIYEFKTPLDNLNVDFKAIEKGFSNAKYTIKDGEIVYQGGKIVASPQGRTYRVKAEVPESWTNSIQDAIEERFRLFYTVNLNNYAIQQDYFPREELIVTKVT
jgi:formylmethanofuran dehydrogenase subunit A